MLAIYFWNFYEYISFETLGNYFDCEHCLYPLKSFIISILTFGALVAPIGQTYSLQLPFIQKSAFQRFVMTEFNIAKTRVYVKKSLPFHFCFICFRIYYRSRHGYRLRWESWRFFDDKSIYVSNWRTVVKLLDLLLGLKGLWFSFSTINVRFADWCIFNADIFYFYSLK